MSRIARVVTMHNSLNKMSINKATVAFIVIAITLISTGAASMIYEVVLIREFTILLGSSYYSGSIVLAAVMGGLAIGSFFIGKLSDRAKNPFLILFILEVLIAIISLVIVPVTRRLVTAGDWILTDVIISTFKIINLNPTSWHVLLIYSSGILIIPAILMGGELPVAIKILSKSNTEKIGEVTGCSYFLDTIGGIFGAISAGIILIPILGSIKTAHAGGFLNIIGAVSVALYMIFVQRTYGHGFEETLPPDNKKRNSQRGAFFTILIVLPLIALFAVGYYQADQLEYTTTADLYPGQVILEQRQSKFQTITVIDHNLLGRVLFLDGREQISEKDDEPYSEALILPATVTLLCNQDDPLNVLMIGGGDLGGLEVLTRFPGEDLGSITLVDLDPVVIEVSKKYFVNIHNDSWQDCRYEYIEMDGRRYIKDAIKDGKEFDLVILDLPDPNDDILATFYSLELYNDVYLLLDDDGIMVTQATQADWALGADGCVVIANTLNRSEFPIVRIYTQYIPSFGGWGFAIASKSYDPLQITEEGIVDVIAEIGTNTYDEKVHFSLFSLPPWLVKDVTGAQYINTIDKPVIIREY